jgi:hypothetical protein
MMSHDVDDEQEERARLEQEIDDGIFNESYWTEDDDDNVVHGQPPTTVYIDSPVLVHTVAQALEYFEQCAKRTTSLRFIRIKLPTRRASKHGTASWNATIVQDYIQLVQRLPLFRNLQLVTLLVASWSDLVIPSEELLPFELLYQLLQQPLQQQQQQQQHQYDPQKQPGQQQAQRHHYEAFRRLGRSSSPLYAALGKLKIRVEVGMARGERIRGAGTSTPLTAATTPTTATTSTAMPASQLTDCQTRDLVAALCHHPSVVEFAMDSLRVPSTLDPILSMLISLPSLRSVHIRLSRRRFQPSLSSSGSGNSCGSSSSSIDSAMGGGDTPQVTGRVLTQLLCRRTLQEFVLQDVGPLQPVRFQELAAAFYPQQSIHCFSLKNIGILAASSDVVPSMTTTTSNTNINTTTNGNHTTTTKKITTTPFSTATLLVGTHTIQKLVVPLPSTQASANALHHMVQEYLVSNRSIATQLDVNVSPTQQGHAEMIVSALADSTEVYPLDGKELWSVMQTTAATVAMGVKEEIKDSNEINDNDKNEKPVSCEDENHNSYNDRHATSTVWNIRDFFLRNAL